MLLAEDLLLLAHYDDTGYRTPADTIELALAGAMLIDLAEHGRVDVVEDTEAGGAYRLEVVDRTPTGHPLLDEWLVKTLETGLSKPTDVVLALAGKLADRLMAGLNDRGILRRQPGTVPNLIPMARWPSEDAHHEQDLLDQLRRVLVDGAQPDQRTAALISVLTAIDGVPPVAGGADRDKIGVRAKEIAEGHWTSENTRRAVEEITAVVMLSIMVPTLSSASGA